MIAIHNSDIGFHQRWIQYCKSSSIPFKLVNCYSNTIISDLEDCKALMWHFSQNIPKDIIIAKQIIFALEHTGFKVFPDFKTSWHFDDKLAQKYLLERINAPMASSYIFFNKDEATQWIKKTDFPKVFKLRGGAGSSNVKLVKSREDALRIIRKAFSSGFLNYSPIDSLKERWRKYLMGKVGVFELIKGVLRIFNPPEFSKVHGREYGYVYFQDFIKNNDSDTRIIVIDGRAFALKRYNRRNDFRASGSGMFSYDKDLFDQRCVKQSFIISEKLNLQCAAFDFVFDSENNPQLLEVSYGFIQEVYDLCPGYWDNEMNWIEGKFVPQNWMVDSVLKSIYNSKSE